MVTGGLLQQAFLLQIICRHALRILALHRNAGVQLLQRFSSRLAKTGGQSAICG